ncbi:hypothetical protein Pan44_33510 [Caulifigura coniformis]|uniref:Cytochrome C assembly protein n=1 Tax=Caulifigura coniformis TaxID=2527983 RepID=A0A517SGQ0_9PLAN|nr:hypothetical protein [Caulifigura coniformis]QDT55308.1 hypothetical protein Pan44_33510 [Caulifigura coniformis]
MSLANTSLTCFLASYALAAALEATRLLRPMPINRWAAWLAAAAGFVAQTIYLLSRSRAIDLPPLLASTHDWLLVVAWLTVPVYLLIALLHKDVPVGLFILPAALLFVIASRFVSREPNAHLDSLRWWGMAHAAFLVLGIAGVVIAGGFSVMYLIQYSRLRHRTGETEGFRLFSLERTARLNWWCIVISVPLLTLGMATGALLTWLSQKTSQPVSLLNWSFLVSGVAWLALVVLFGWLLTSRRPTGRIVAWRTLLAGGFVLATVVTLGIVSGGMHGRGRSAKAAGPANVGQAATIGLPSTPSTGRPS